MRINRFFAFQQHAIEALQKMALMAHKAYDIMQTPQVVSFTAPTGAGKTIMVTAMMENIYMGTDQFPAQPNAIFIWLSDSPELNQQSRDKIDLKSDKIRLNQCITIKEDSFDRETLEEGHIYFLNTQKLGKNSNLTSHSDTRQHTIWETLANTVKEKENLLYVIIDEAHRGAKTNQTSIMQKFIKGSKTDGLPPMPVVIGMSATSERFNRLVASTSSTIHPVVVTPEEVRESGLLKDKIIISYPELSNASEIAVLEAAADEWKHKCDHWKQFCDMYHHERVNPIFLLQVMNGSEGELSATNLDVCVQKIEERTGYKFEEGEVVHTFGQTTSTLELNGLEVPYIEPSKIADDKKIRVVFFKENLSTGWDCPRAETMMSFRHAADATYIAQLLGRMVRTPIQQRIQRDESLNDVHLYLPHFDSKTVSDVVKALQSVEGGALPTDILSEELGDSAVQLMGCNTPLRRRVPQKIVDNMQQLELNFPFTYPETEETISTTQDPERHYVKVSVPVISGSKSKEVGKTKSSSFENLQVEIEYTYEDISRVDIIRFINNLALSTCHIRTVQISSYLISLYALCRFLVQTNLNNAIFNHVYGEILTMIHTYAQDLRAHNRYERMKRDILSFKLHSQVFDIFGQDIFRQNNYSETSISEMNLSLQLQQADNILGKEGIPKLYRRKYGTEQGAMDCKIDVILFSLDNECLKRLDDYAKGKFFELNDTYRRSVVTLDEMKQKRYTDIVKNGSTVSEVNFTLPETIEIRKNETSEAGEELAITYTS